MIVLALMLPSPLPQQHNNNNHHRRLLMVTPPVNMLCRSPLGKDDGRDSIARMIWVTTIDRPSPSTRNNTEKLRINTNIVTLTPTPPTLSQRIEPPPCIPLLRHHSVLKVVPTGPTECTITKIQQSAKSGSEPRGNRLAMSRSVANLRRLVMPISVMCLRHNPSSRPRMSPSRSFVT